MDSIVRKANDVAQRLPAVLAALRSAAPQLAMSCVSPARSFRSRGRADVVLGRARAEANARMMRSTPALTTPLPI